MKPALIDLDVIEIVKESIKAAGGGDPENVLTVKTFEEMAEFYIENISSQPALVELLKSAIKYGIVFGTKNSKNDSIDLTPAFQQFLTQNNLTDEKEK